MFVLCILIFLITPNVMGKKLKNEAGGREFCLRQNRLISLERDGELIVVETSSGRTISLKCGFCDEDNTQEPRVWMHWSLRTGQTSVLQFSDRIFETLERSLVIRNVSEEDVGIYLCKLPYEDSLQSSFNFLVDEIESNDMVEGNLTDWLIYTQHFFEPVNVVLKHPSYLNSINSEINFEAIPIWSEWSECEVCVSRPMKHRVTHCRVRPMSSEPTTYDSTTSSYESKLRGNYESNAFQILLETAGALPCRGSFLRQLLEEISVLVKQVPNFLLKTPCAPSCPKRKGNREPLEKRVLALDEGGHAIVPCHSGEGLGNVHWEHNNRRINFKELNGMITVDHFGNLHLVAVGPIAKGNYDCYSTEKKLHVLELHLSVRSESRLFGNEFRRHAFYLGIVTFLSSVTFSFIILGIFWRKKRCASIQSKYRWRGPIKPLLKTEDESETE